MPFSVPLVTLIAIAPGVAAWWTGRRIAPVTGHPDPALPELLLARRQRLLTFSTTAFFVTAFVGGRNAYWAAPLLVVGMIIGGYPLHQRLGIESDGLLRHLWRSAKSIVGGMGFWIFLALTPEIVLALGPRYQLFALLLIPILIAWEHWYPRLWLWLHDAEPLSGEHLTPRIDTIIQRAGIVAPRVYRIGGAGTRFMNALAFPSVHHPSIGLGNALVELLEPDEVAAIYAHELSHIEQYSPRKIRRVQAITRALIVVAVMLPLVVQRVAPSLLPWVPWVWLAGFVTTMILRGRESKRRETESDARAAALCGDPEIVVRALIKVHVHGFIPRRWSVDFERGASHPSLARRIQALRGESAASLATFDAPTVLSTAREGSAVVFDNSRAYWFDGVPTGTAPALDALQASATSTRSVAWAELVELRVETRGEIRALRARHRNGDTWSVPLDAAHVDTVQKALDVMDVRLHRDLGKSTVLQTRILSVLIVCAILWTGDVGVVLLPAALALFRPSTAIFAALGVMSFFAAVLELAQRWSPSDLPDVRLIVLAVCGCAALWVAWHRARREQKRDGVRLTLLVLGGVAVIILVLGVMLATELPIVDVAQQSIGHALALTFAGLAGALVLVRPRAAKLAAASAACLALVVAGPSIASATLFDRSNSFARTQVKATEVGRVPLTAEASELQLSPDGTHFLVREALDDDDIDAPVQHAGHYAIGAAAGVQRHFAASQVGFADDQHLLILRAVESGWELRLERVDSGTVWTAILPTIRRATLSVAPHDRSWAIVGEDPRGDSLVFVTGTSDSAQFVLRRFAEGGTTKGGRRLLNTYARIVVGERLIAPSFDLARASSPTAILGMRMPRADLLEVTANGRQKIGTLDGYPQCGPADDGRAACIVRSRFDRGQVWVIERSGPPRRVGEVVLDEMGRFGFGPGARITMVQNGTRVFDVDAGARRIVDIRLPADSGYVAEAMSAPGRLAVIRHDNDATSLIMYRVVEQAKASP